MITWREQIVIKILLLVARMLCDDDELSTQIKHVSNAVNARNAA